MDDSELSVIKKDRAEFFNNKDKKIKKEKKRIKWSAESLEKGGFPHYMLKEIHEQPNIIKKNIKSILTLKLKG